MKFELPEYPPGNNTQQTVGTRVFRKERDEIQRVYSETRKEIDNLGRDYR